MTELEMQDVEQIVVVRPTTPHAPGLLFLLGGVILGVMGYCDDPSQPAKRSGPLVMSVDEG